MGAAVRSTRRGAAGFTLTELLVVIGIIVLLAATAVPALQAFRRGQRLDSAARITQMAFSDARRLAITKRARHVVVLFSYEDPQEPQGTLARVRHGLRIYCEPMGEPGTRGAFPGGWVDKPVLLPAGIRFAQEKMKFAQVFGPVANPSEPLPVDSDQLARGAEGRTIGIRRDGTFDYDPSLDHPAVHPEVGVNIYLPDERFYMVPDGWLADVVLVEADPNGREIVAGGKRRRAFIDLDPRTGRASARVFEIGSRAERE